VSAVATRDSQAIALLCAPLAVGGAKPLTSSEWTRLAAAIHASPLERPGALVGLTAADLGTQLGLGVDTADRVASLLDRGGTLAFELERLADRGVWLVTRADDEYPQRLRQRLGLEAPAVLFGAGRRDAVPARGVAVIGSRDGTPAALEFAEQLGRSVASQGATVVSGAARGVDRTAMSGALGAGGTAVGVVADALVRLTQQPEVREALVDERLTLVTPYSPEARFTIGNAMGRNRFIYCLSDVAVVVATSAGSGGTWAGAIENAKAGWIPLLVWDSAAAPAGNRELLAQGGRPISSPSAATLLDDLGETSLDPPDEESGGDSDALLSAVEPYLATPRTEKEVRDNFGLGQGAARAVLRAGVESGRFVREGRPYRYVTAGVAMQARLFDAA